MARGLVAAVPRQPIAVEIGIKIPRLADDFRITGRLCVGKCRILNRLKEKTLDRLPRSLVCDSNFLHRFNLFFSNLKGLTIMRVAIEKRSCLVRAALRVPRLEAPEWRQHAVFEAVEECAGKEEQCEREKVFEGHQAVSRNRFPSIIFDTSTTIAQN